MATVGDTHDSIVTSSVEMEENSAAATQSGHTDQNSEIQARIIEEYSVDPLNIDQNSVASDGGLDDRSTVQAGSEGEHLDLSGENVASSSKVQVKKRVRVLRQKQRSSERIKKTPRYYRKKLGSGTTSKWTYLDKERLLGALKKYGVRNIPKLVQAVGTKTGEHIKDFIQLSYRTTHMTFSVKKPQKKTGQAANRAKKMLKAPIECWLQKIEEAQSATDYSNLLSTTFAYIAKYEPHPDPEHCGGVNYKAIYRYIASLLRGEPPRDLSAVDSKKVLELIKQLADDMKQLKLTRERMFLETYARLPSKTAYPVRTYGGKKKTVNPQTASDDSQKLLEKLDKINGMNVLQIPLEFLNPSSKN